MENFINILYRLRIIFRWDTSYCHLKESVSEHSYYVAVISMLLYEIDLDNQIISESEVDLTNLLVYALYHDSFESYSAHIISPVKKASQEIKNSVYDINDLYKEKLLSLLPKQGFFITKRAFGNIDENIIKYIELADILEAYIYACFEVYLGNQDFYDKMILFEKRVNELATTNTCVKIFLSDILSDSFNIKY